MNCNFNILWMVIVKGVLIIKSKIAGQNMRISQIRTIRPILISIGAGIICNALWLFEIVNFKGWNSLNWLDSYMLSVFVIIPLTVLSLLTSLNYALKLGIRLLLMSFLLLCLISFISFEIARMGFYTIYSRFYFSTDSTLLIVLTSFLTPILIFSIGYFYIIRKLIIRIPGKVILMFPFSILVSVAFGLITVRIHPGLGFGYSFIDSVKMGYPIFWLNVTFGLIVTVILRLHLDKSH